MFVSNKIECNWIFVDAPLITMYIYCSSRTYLILYQAFLISAVLCRLFLLPTAKMQLKRLKPPNHQCRHPGTERCAWQVFVRPQQYSIQFHAVYTKHVRKESFPMADTMKKKKKCWVMCLLKKCTFIIKCIYLQEMLNALLNDICAVIFEAPCDYFWLVFSFHSKFCIYKLTTCVIQRRPQPLFFYLFNDKFNYE